MAEKKKHIVETAGNVPAAAAPTASVDDSVRLRPLWGIAPGKYLSALYALAVLAGFFLIFMYPGLARRGTVYRVTSEPPGAAVRVDDVYAGQTPCTLVIPRGERTVSVVLAGFTPASQILQVPARLFIRRPFARARALHVPLAEREPFAALAAGAREAAAWSFTGEPTAVYAVPPALSTGARASAMAGGADGEAARGLLLAASRFATSRFALKELSRAAFYLDAAGGAPSPGAFLHTVAVAAALAAENPLLSVLPASLLPEPLAAQVLQSGLYPRQMIDFSVDDKIQRGSLAVFGETLTVGGVRFRAVSGGTFTQAANFPREVRVEPFYLALDEISVSDWEAFVQAVPAWNIANTPELVEQGLVSVDYMLGSSAADYPYPTVPGISAAAAAAYCQWLSGRLPESLWGWEVRLPLEAEWEYAAKTVQENGADASLPRRMVSGTPSGAGLWEWCADGYAPQNYIAVPPDAARAVPSPQRNVRGGCWINALYTVTAETRASLPPDSCSPFVSARPVIAKKAD